MPKTTLQKPPEKVKDISGQKFGRWTVIEYSHLKTYYSSKGYRVRIAYWRCLCKCGTIKTVTGSSICNGTSKSCSCWRKELLAKRNFKHGHSPRGKRSLLYLCWKGMKSRCHREKDKNYSGYGARGIYVCKRWRNSFSNFVSDMPKKPGTEYSIDRIDNNGPYSKANCKWSTAKEQANNRRPPQFLHGDRRFNPKSGGPEHLKFRMAFKKKRIQLNLSQAKAGKILGVSPAAIRKWEIGSCQPMNSWKKVLKLLGASKKKPTPA
ncbi:hypothetical protein LCGC14_0817110 [marine sediment metagenome]|uniref:HTH cro/C1-type domain-containing protein n=1 Tax=marine sediment metagenome TaxID=412755 RepID=A0A0F9PJT7_9ZZZZ